MSAKGPGSRADYLGRFMSYVEFDPNSGCWLWSRYCTEAGYGLIRQNGRRRVRAHRVSWTLFRGAIGNLHVLHRCDTPACVNPEHLFLGTNADNVADMLAKGRGVLPPAPRGERNANAKLTAKTAFLLRRDMIERTGTLRQIAARYGVSPSTACRIKAGRAWNPADAALLSEDVDTDVKEPV